MTATRARASDSLIDWALLIVPGTIWGASFLFIAEGLDAMEPNGVTFTRIAIGFLTLSLVPSARRPIVPADRVKCAGLGVLWLAFPLSMFPFAERHVSSALTGMLNGATPLFVAAVAALIARARPRASDPHRPRGRVLRGSPHGRAGHWRRQRQPRRCAAHHRGARVVRRGAQSGASAAAAQRRTPDDVAGAWRRAPSHGASGAAGSAQRALVGRDRSRRCSRSGRSVPRWPTWWRRRRRAAWARPARRRPHF